MRSAARLLLFSQLSLLVFVLVCLLLIPNFLFQSDEGGISNYGVYARTIIPYTLAFGICGVLMLMAASILPMQIVNQKGLQRVLYMIGGLHLFVLESTYLYQVNNLLDTLHILSGVLLFLAETLVAVWLWHTFPHDGLQVVWFSVELLGFVLSLLTFLGLLHLLFIAEMVTGAGFGVLLVRTVDRIAVVGSVAER